MHSRGMREEKAGQLRASEALPFHVHSEEREPDVFLCSLNWANRPVTQEQLSSKVSLPTGNLVAGLCLLQPSLVIWINEKVPLLLVDLTLRQLWKGPCPQTKAPSLFWGIPPCLHRWPPEARRSISRGNIHGSFPWTVPLCTCLSRVLISNPLRSQMYIGLSNEMYGHHSQPHLDWSDQAGVTWCWLDWSNSVPKKCRPGTEGLFSQCLENLKCEVIWSCSWNGQGTWNRERTYGEIMMQICIGTWRWETPMTSMEKPEGSKEEISGHLGISVPDSSTLWSSSNELLPINSTFVLKLVWNDSVPCKQTITDEEQF